MNIIKLSAIASTNDYLKQLCASQSLESFTIVITENQTNGKGQRGNQWNVEPYKNLTFSVLIKDLLISTSSVFDLNIAVSLSIVEALEKLKVLKLNIKWPNDILADGKKIGGILIENSISGQNSMYSIIGIGLNVNQTDFGDLPKASSLKNVMQTDFDKEEILFEIIDKIKYNYTLILTGKSDQLWQKYHNYLFRKGIPTVFENPIGDKFMGIILHVLKNGKIQIMLEDDSVKEFDLKEVGMIY